MSTSQVTPRRRRNSAPVRLASTPGRSAPQPALAAGRPALAAGPFPPADSAYVLQQLLNTIDELIERLRDDGGERLARLALNVRDELQRDQDDER